MNTKNLFIKENELLELTDAELTSVCGGYGFHSGRHHGGNYANGGNYASGGNAYAFGPVRQNATAVSSFNGSGPITANSGGFVGSYAANSYSNTWNIGTYVSIYL